MEADVECLVGGLNRVIDRVVRHPMSNGAIGDVVRRAALVEAPLRVDPVRRDALAWLTGMGPLDPLLRDPEVTDVLVNGPDDVWIERAGVLQRTDVVFPDAAAVLAAVERALLPLGLRIDRMSPAVDARLPDGSRLHAIVPPASVAGPVVAIRRFVVGARTLDDLERSGSIDGVGARILAELVTERRSLIVSGATGAGKTTMLNVLSRLIPHGERIVTIEEAAELDLAGHVVRLEARPPNAEGAGEITVRTLVRHALRMRPDRIVVGEVRGPEAFDLIQAMSTGHEGSLGTVHASGPEEALWRIETLAATAPETVPLGALRRMLRSAIHALVHVERRGASRRVAAIAGVGTAGVTPLWTP